MGDKKILSVIPVFNNEKTIAAVVRGVREMGLPVLVVNDGSTDNSLSALDGLPVERIDFSRNMGKGKAIRSAFQWALEHGYTHLITIDADNQHNPADIAQFLEKINEAPGKIIIGKRNFNQEVPGSSRFGRAWSNMWIRIASGGKTPDSQSGFRAYPVEPLGQMRFIGSRYEFEIEVLVKAVWAGLELDWVDISVRYFRGNERVSHFKPFLDNLRISLMYTLLVTRNILPIPHRRRFTRKESNTGQLPYPGDEKIKERRKVDFPMQKNHHAQQ